MSSLVSTGSQEIVNWVTTADGCVHTADADATKQFHLVGVGGVYWALRHAWLHSGYTTIDAMLETGTTSATVE